MLIPFRFHPAAEFAFTHIEDRGGIHDNILGVEKFKVAAHKVEW